MLLMYDEHIIARKQINLFTFALTNSVPAVAVIQKGLVLLCINRCKMCVGWRVSALDV